jgi:hypothetical protein
MVKGTVKKKKPWMLSAKPRVFLNSRMIPQPLRDSLKGGLCQYEN